MVELAARELAAGELAVVVVVLLLVVVVMMDVVVSLAAGALGTGFVGRFLSVAWPAVFSGKTNVNGVLVDRFNTAGFSRCAGRGFADTRLGFFADIPDSNTRRSCFFDVLLNLLGIRMNNVLNL